MNRVLPVQSSAPGRERARALSVGERISTVQNSNECVIAFPVLGGIFGVARLATKLNKLLDSQQIGPWHVGQWIDFKHTAIRIKFLTARDGELARRSWADAC